MSDHSWLPKGAKFPLPSPPAPVKGKFRFQRPASVKVVGSYLLGTVTKPDLNVDIAVQMPKVRRFENFTGKSIPIVYKILCFWFMCLIFTYM